MNLLKEFLEENILIADGAMGTYFSSLLKKEGSFAELGNISNPDIILSIHKEYLESGSNLIRTNTFSANSILMPNYNVKDIIQKSYDIAKKAISIANSENNFIACSIGPIADIKDGISINKNRILEEYIFIIDCFLEKNADIFMFETFSSIDYLDILTKYIKENDKDSFIITSFAPTLSGVTRKGIDIKSIITSIENIKTIDAYGINCGIGPYHSYELLKNMKIAKTMCCLPNAGYPQIVNERTIYSANTDYFANKILEIKNLGVKIIGGCCGTTPEHIKKIRQNINSHISYKKETLVSVQSDNIIKKQDNHFLEKINNNKFPIAVELDSPIGIDISKFMYGAKELKKSGVDIITIADSPLSRPRMDSIILGAKVKRELDIDVMPHICCRDKNIIAIKSQLLACYMENIRNLLLITGDPIASPDRSEIKSVFNLNSYGLMNLIKQMNGEQFKNDMFAYGGAINLRVGEEKRIEKKINAGAKFFLTQPIYTDHDIKFIKKLKTDLDIKVLAGIMPIVSFKNAQFLDNEIPGINIPKYIINSFYETMTRDEATKTGINIATYIGNEIKNHVDGFYFMTPFNRTSIICEIITNLKN